MKRILALSLVAATPAYAGSVSDLENRLKGCETLEDRIAMVAPECPGAVHQHTLSDEHMAAFRDSIGNPAIDKVVWLQCDEYDRLYIISLRDGCKVRAGSMAAPEFRKRSGM